MILTFTPQQHDACEVAQVVFDAPWWMSETLAFPDDKEEEDASSKAQDEEKTGADTDTKSPPDNKASPKNNQQKPQRRSFNCNNSGAAKNFFQPCRGYNRSARLARQQANNDAQQKKNAVATRTIEQRTPIHMHEETPQVAKMSLDVTGFNPQDIAVHVENRVVSIRGQRTNKLGDVFVVDRRFRLKNTASVDDVTASFEDGILEVTVPKKSITAGCRKIPIAVSSSSDDEEAVTAPTKASSSEEFEASTSSENKAENSNDNDDEEAEAEFSPSTKDDANNAEEDQEEEGIPITVQDKQDDETKDDDESADDDKEVETSATASDEAWEEVSN